MDPIVALDLETTGLDPDQDSIIEIGAVLFTDRRVEDVFSTLINPGKRIPPFITQLTGINDQMVIRAPSIHEIMPELKKFIGDTPILGHNIRFDLSFLNRQGLFRSNPILDTYEMASVLIPNAGRYNLGALTQALSIPFPATHRATDDAHATRGLFLRLYEEAMQMPIYLLAEIIRLAEPVEWAGYLPFRMALKERSREIVSSQSIQLRHMGPLYDERPQKQYVPLTPLEHPNPLDADEAASLLEPGGAFARHFHDFEYRPQQVAMLKGVVEAFSESRHLLVEAGTGTGKSMAYLIPAALWALKNNKRVVISTNTINLQDQLINKDIPDLEQVMGVNIQATVLKGRANYFCPRRFESFRRRGPENADEMRVLAKVLIWLQATESGDRAELNLNGPSENNIWMRLSAEDEDCTTENCLRRTGGICPFYRVRQAAQHAHILIVNHALLLADVATGNKVLPEYEYLIVDEAHHLEDATTDALSFRVTLAELERVLFHLGGAGSGLLGWLVSAVKEVLPPSDFASVNHLVEKATDVAFRLQHLSRQFFQSVDQFLIEQRDGRPIGMYSHQERIINATRTQPAWAGVELAWDETMGVVSMLLDLLAKLNQVVVETMDQLSEEDEDLHGSLLNLYRRLDEFQRNTNALVFEPLDDHVYWVEVQSNGYRLTLNAAPLHIGQLMEKYLWHEKISVVLTSATLTTTGEFDYLRSRLNAEDAYELALGSPFDYETAAMVYITNDIPEPSDRNGHQRAIETGLINLCRTTNGRALVLFTSYDQLKRTSKAIGPALAKHDIIVYEQGEGASPHSLLENFRTSEKAVLLGTRAFWEGVDIPGEALSVLVIAKLPFNVPSDPIVAARSETFDDPFYQYSLPEAILRFRQGFGRLIRTQQDRGIVVIMDRRVLTKRYGRLFIDSLPPCTIQNGSLMDLPKTAARWLNL
ncbi:MAG TPA: helicase C-terminal domain-containing protein [Anaerolineales bacterium]|nr:helicase C-terminal domain-containing protein [Anaerolineales bacterium]